MNGLKLNIYRTIMEVLQPAPLLQIMQNCTYSPSNPSDYSMTEDSGAQGSVAALRQSYMLTC